MKEKTRGIGHETHSRDRTHNKIEAIGHAPVLNEGIKESADEENDDERESCDSQFDERQLIRRLLTPPRSAFIPCAFVVFELAINRLF